MLNSKNRVEIIPDGEIIGTLTPNMQCLFDRHLGLVSLRTQGREWIYRAPQPAYWRATTDNDRGQGGKQGFTARTASWFATDMFPHCIGFEAVGQMGTIPIEPAASLMSPYVEVTYTYETLTTPVTPVTLTYRLTTTGLHVATRFKAIRHYRCSRRLAVGGRCRHRRPALLTTVYQEKLIRTGCKGQAKACIRC